MRKQLAKYSIPEPILGEWEKRFSGTLLPLQYRAIEEYNLLDGQSLLISAPTSSGKTFCGEMALIRAVQQRRKGIFLVPLKAVAEEKYRRFTEAYGASGLRVTIATRDYPENDQIIETGRFDIAVMVYEKFNALLLANFDLMGQVGTLVVDELQMLEDPQRGVGLELALTKLLYSHYRPQLVALSAVVGEATDLAAWLGCRLLLEKSRPVELRRGVAAGGKFYFRCHNSGERGEEPFREGDDVISTLFENINAETAAGRQTLVFLKSRLQTIEAARRFAQYAGLEKSEEKKVWFDSRLADEEESSLTDTLRSLFSRGIAFHNADLTTAQRMAVEDGYRAGLVQVVFATTTLATGINLPASTVFIEAQKYCRQGYTSRAGMEPLSWSEYESMSGRAGRMGLTKGNGETGKAVLFAASELEKSILWDFYVENKPTPLESQLPACHPADIIVDLFSSELLSRIDDIPGVLTKSYAGSCNRLIINDISATVEELVDGGFLSRQGDDITATPLGRAVALSGLSVAGTGFILDSVKTLPDKSNEQIIYHLAGSPDGQQIYAPGGEKAGRVRLPNRFFSGTDGDPLVQELSALRRELTAGELARLRLSFLLADWMAGVSALDIENSYRLYAGMMDNLARQCAWLLRAAGMVIRAYDRFSLLPQRLEQLAFSAGHGLPYELKGIHDELGTLCHRSELVALHRAGITGLDKLLTGDNSILRKNIMSAERLTKIEEKIHQIKEEGMWTNQSMQPGMTILPQSIEIEGTPVRERYLIRINGRAISLTGKSFKYFLRLAWSRLTKDNGWLYKEDLEQGFNQARYLYRLRQEIGRDFLPEWPLYENNRSGYYRLAAERERIRVNLSALKDNPDFEIRQMVSDLAPQSAN